MKKMDGAIAGLIVDEYGTDEFMIRLSDPYWFQAFGCALGFDWHSSGVTTTVCGALKAALKKEDLGIYAARGKGNTGKDTLSEIETDASGRLFEAKIHKLSYASRISAKVDSSLVQDGYDLHHHFFMYDNNGKWAVVQQGMNANNLYARRYHWLKDSVYDFVEEPHRAICCNASSEILNVSAKESKGARDISLDLVRDNCLSRFSFQQRNLLEFMGQRPSILTMKKEHWIRDFDLTHRDREVLKRAYEYQPESFEEMLSLDGFGKKKIRALALVSDLIYGSPASARDPVTGKFSVRFLYTVGGKDGTPEPVNAEVYDTTIDFLRNALGNARLGEKDKITALQRLNSYVCSSSSYQDTPEVLRQSSPLDHQQKEGHSPLS